jgi:Tfp pilus assembly protein PilN
MIELNLLPDVKMEYVKAQRSQRLVISVAFLVSAAAIALLLLLLSYDGLQKKHLSDLSSNITSSSQKLQNEPQINKILTVQNQLGSLNTLHSSEPAAARLFNYLNEVTPQQVDINSLNIDFTAYTVTITGTTDSLSSVNLYVDTLKLTTYTSATSSTALPAFSGVVLSSFGLSSSATNAAQAASYTITLSYDKTIFDTTQTVNLTVPSTTTTRVSAAQSNDLFKTAPAPPAGTTPTTGTKP